MAYPYTRKPRAEFGCWGLVDRMDPTAPGVPPGEWCNCSRQARPFMLTCRGHAGLELTARRDQEGHGDWLMKVLRRT